MKLLEIATPNVVSRASNFELRLFLDELFGSATKVVGRKMAIYRFRWFLDLLALG